MAQKKKNRKKEISKIKKQAEKKQLEPKVGSAIKEKKIEDMMPMEKKETRCKTKESKSKKDNTSVSKKDSKEKNSSVKKEEIKKTTSHKIDTKSKKEKEPVKKKNTSVKAKTTKEKEGEEILKANKDKKKNSKVNASKKKTSAKKKKSTKVKKKTFKEQGILLGNRISSFLHVMFQKIKEIFFHLFLFSKRVGKKCVILFVKFIRFSSKVVKESIFSFPYFLKKYWQIHLEKKRIKKEMRMSIKEYLYEEEKSANHSLEENKEIVIENKKKKKRVAPILVLVILGVSFFLFVTYPYGVKIYRSGASGSRLEVPKLSKLKEECCNFSATFTSIRSVKSLQKELDKLISSYEVLNCDQVIYYYNPVGDYTITDYSVTNGKFFNEFTITYGKGNSCDIDTTFKKLELLSPSFSIEDAKRDGNYVIYEGKIFNADAYDTFMKQVEQKNPAILRIVSTTKDGDVLITDLEYLSEGKFKVTHDKTRDRNNKDNFIMAYKYEHLGIYKGKLYAYNGSNLSSDLIKTKNAYYLLAVEK